MKRVYGILGAAVLMCSIAAGEAAEIKIGFVDVERIRRESAPAERASKQLEKEFAPRAQELQRREAQLKAAQGNLEKEAMTMSESDRRAREQELARLSVDYQRMQREYREDLNLRRNQELILSRIHYWHGDVDRERVAKLLSNFRFVAETYGLVIPKSLTRRATADLAILVTMAVVAMRGIDTLYGLGK